MSHLSSFSRFREPTLADEYAHCQGCGEKFHYTSLDGDGYCYDCRYDGGEDEQRVRKHETPKRNSSNESGNPGDRSRQRGRAGDGT